MSTLPADRCSRVMAPGRRRRSPCSTTTSRSRRSTRPTLSRAVRPDARRSSGVEPQLGGRVRSGPAPAHLTCVPLVDDGADPATQFEDAGRATSSCPQPTIPYVAQPAPATGPTERSRDPAVLERGNCARRCASPMACARSSPPTGRSRAGRGPPRGRARPHPRHASPQSRPTADGLPSPRRRCPEPTTPRPDTEVMLAPSARCGRRVCRRLGRLHARASRGAGSACRRTRSNGRAYWIGTPERRDPAAGAEASDVADWFLEPRWHEAALPVDRDHARGRRVLVLDDETGLGRAVVAQLRADGVLPIVVRRGTTSDTVGDDARRHRSGRARRDFARLATARPQSGRSTGGRHRLLERPRRSAPTPTRPCGHHVAAHGRCGSRPAHDASDRPPTPVLLVARGT